MRSLYVHSKQIMYYGYTAGDNTKVEETEEKT
jgi:hypothetical protein